jgi:type II secretory pathway component GspD/PulD (secretin)
LRFLTHYLLLCLLGVSLFLFGGRLPFAVAWAQEAAFGFENAELSAVIKKVTELTGLTFIFNPEEIKGKVTILLSRKVSSEEALRLLQSALAVHGYSLLRKEDTVWIVPQQAAHIEVVPLDYGNAEELAATMAYLAPYSLRVVPYYPTNSLILYGDSQAVKALV